MREQTEEGAERKRENEKQGTQGESEDKRQRKRGDVEEKGTEEDERERARKKKKEGEGERGREKRQKGGGGRRVEPRVSVFSLLTTLASRGACSIAAQGREEAGTEALSERSRIKGRARRPPDPAKHVRRCSRAVS